MIDKLYQFVLKGVDVRQNLSKLRQAVKSNFLREELQEIVQENAKPLLALLQNEDAKTRKNVALLMGDLQLELFSPALYKAYEDEQQLFVKSAYLTALQNLDCHDYLEKFHERMTVLSQIELTEENRKHITEEMRELSALLVKAEGIKKHKFIGGHEPSEIILLTSRNHMEITMGQLKAIPSLNTSEARMLHAGIRIKEDCLDKILPIRTWQDILFLVKGMKTCELDAVHAAKTIAESGLLDFMQRRHSGKAPFYFRVELKTKRMPLDKKSAFTKKMASEIERLSERQLINSTSDYELELRLIENKEGKCNVLVKLYTIIDNRFSYRREVIPTSIKPVNAALLVELARNYMVEDARVLDPFCGVGTMLIERQKQIPANTSYGIDVNEEAILKGRSNAAAAGQIIHFINRDYFDFTHEYLFDEIFTNMPFAIGRKTPADIFEIYERFFEESKKHLQKNGVIILYSHDKEFVRRLLTQKTYGYTLEKSMEINAKEETSLLIIRNNG